LRCVELVEMYRAASRADRSGRAP